MAELLEKHNESVRRHGVTDMIREFKSSILRELDYRQEAANLRLLRENLARYRRIVIPAAIDDNLSIKVDAIDERRLIEGMEKIANRITLGLILASLVVGAAMLMSVPTTFRILGYPGIAMVFFLAAAAGGMMLVVNILMMDAKRPKKSPDK